MDDDVDEDDIIYTNVASISSINQNWVTVDDSLLHWDNVAISPTQVCIDTDLTVQGRNILKELDEIQEMLNILKSDLDMENRYPELARLKNEYNATLEKYKTFDRLKDSK